MSFFKKLAEGLKKTKKSVVGALGSVARGFSKVDDDLFDEFEETLIMADVGVNTSLEIMDRLREKVKEERIKEPLEAVEALKTIMAGMIDDEDSALKTGTKPSVILVIGVNGVGKTTSIAKIAHYLEGQKKKVILGAADTFRAAAVDQIQIWADRAGVDIVRQNMGSDPASVAFDTVKAAVARGADVAIIDTAGRLHNRIDLMNELGKIRSVCAKVIPDAPHDVMLILDASTGQNAFQQAKEFSKATQISSITVTKLDGTAKGGVVVGLTDQFGVPVKFIGTGEGIDDIAYFDRDAFVASLFNPEDLK